MLRLPLCASPVAETSLCILWGTVSLHRASGTGCLVSVLCNVVGHVLGHVFKLQDF